ncbi:MAG: IS3 family transposase [Acidobacteriia bacterium]|nr:IS3 family transposase [Terriglobia bacterium]MBV9767631.1 IS3 family transposase [Acidobacteriaceae bacterium]
MTHLQGKGKVERLCRLAGVSRAGFYRHWQQSQPDEEEVALCHRIEQLFIEHRSHYGVRRITRLLRMEGMRVNHKRVERVMREDQLLAVGKRKFIPATTNSNHDLPVYLNLAARVKATAINQVWVADITYIRLRQQFVFLAVVIDRYSRRVIGRAVSKSIDTELTLSALQQAIKTREPRPGLVHHSDQGIQYAAQSYVAVLEAHGILPSMSRPGNPYDNAFCESFMKTLKKEEVHCSEYKNLKDLKIHIEDFIDRYYNQQRMHSALGYISPANFEAAANVAADDLRSTPRMKYFEAPQEVAAVP